MYADWSLVLLAGPLMLKRSKGRDHTKSGLLVLQVEGGGGGRRNTNRGCHCWGCNDTLWTKPAGHPKANRPHHQLLECEDHGRGNKGRASTCSYGDERVWDWSARDKWGQARTHTLHLGKRVLIGQREEDHNYLEKDWGEKAKHSRVEEMGSSQSTCMRQKVLVRQHYACTYWHERHDDDDDHSKVSYMYQWHLFSCMTGLKNSIMRYIILVTRLRILKLKNQWRGKFWQKVLRTSPACMRPTNFENINLNILGWSC